MADFESVARRALATQPIKLLILKYLFVRGLSAQQTMGVLAKNAYRTEAATFNEMVQQMKVDLGRVFSELKPYALYPPKTYLRQSRLSDCTEPEQIIEDARNSGMQLADQLAKNKK